MPMVSVIIPVYNRENLLPRALRSVLAQTGFPIEIIVVDDASTDGTTDGVIKWCQESGIECNVSSDGCLESESVIHSAPLTISQCIVRLIKLHKNSGPAVARNRGLAKATGEYAAFLDSDDEWLPGSLSARIDIIEGHGDIDLVFCDMENAVDGRTTLDSFLHTRNVWPKLKYSRQDDGLCLSDNLFDCQLIQPLVGTPTVVIRRKILTDRLRFDERLRVAEDWELWLRVFRNHKGGFLDKVLVRRNLQSDNLTWNPSGWLDANIMAGLTILRSYDLSFSQKIFLRRRLSDDYFELGYHIYRQGGNLKAQRNQYAESFIYWPSWKALKRFAYSMLAGVIGSAEQIYTNMDIVLSIVKRTLPKPVKKMIKRMVVRFRDPPFKPYLKSKSVEGVTFCFWIGDSVGRQWYDVQSTDPVWVEMRFIRDNLIHPGDSVIECGGHHGCTAILLSHWVGAAGKILTFEASPANCKIIEKNIRINKLQNVRLEKKAVGSASGKVIMNDDSNSSVTMSGEGTEVTMVCLDAYAQWKPDFVKIDVEGFEMQVLQGGQKIFATRPKFAIEIHAEMLSRYGASVHDILKLIGAENYKLWIQWENDQWPVEYDLKTPITKRVHLFGVPLLGGSLALSPLTSVPRDATEI